MNVADILTFFSTSSRSENDASNKIRENILKIILHPPKEFMNHIEYGSHWHKVTQAWNETLKKIAKDTHIPPYTVIKSISRGGRKYHYDVDVMYYNGSDCVANRKIEFKNGGTTINDLSQFLSLQAKINLFPETYDTFYYKQYLDSYLACDTGITEKKPSLTDYLKRVTSKNYAISPFFAQLKERELIHQPEKNQVVNTSITDYLTRFHTELNIKAFSEKIKETQKDKIFVLWDKEQFHVDKMEEQEMSHMSFHAIKNGNVLEVDSCKTRYGLLLRWRNHKGILNPAWQISMKRLL